MAEINEYDFSTRRHFPGTEGGPFELLLRLSDPIENLPALLFALILLGIAFTINITSPLKAACLWMFYLGDWLILSLCVKAGRSFGPTKPPTLFLALLRLLAGWLPYPILVIPQGIGTLLVIYAFWIEPLQLHVTKVELETDKLSPGSSLRLLHLADLHLERVTIREQRLIELCHELQPDIILFSGDFLSFSNVGDPVAWQEASWVLSQLHGKLGSFAVTGSPPVDVHDAVSNVISGTDFGLLQDECVNVVIGGRKIEIYGISCSHRPFLDEPNLSKLLDSEGNDSFKILLYHSPDLAPAASRLGMDLQLSGHTHGGQVRLPYFGALYTSSLYGKRFEAGRYKLGSMTLYVSRGIGLEGKGAPRVRFLCPPEITCWTIRGK